MHTVLSKSGALALMIELLCVVHAVPSAEQDGIIKIRLSYKIILNPKNHSRPTLNTRVGETVRDEMIRETVEEMNSLMASYWRGYRFELTEILEIGSLNGWYPDPSHFYDVDFIEQDKKIKLLRQMEAAIKAYPKLYAWREDAVNVYINQATRGAKWKYRDLIVTGASAVGESWVQLHELGHFFDLRHTQGGLGVAVPGESGEGFSVPGDDNVEDTIEDLPGWSRDEIARHNFSIAYEKLSSEQKELVEDVAENIMSYHFLKPVSTGLHRLTEGQLDRWTDTTLNFYRRKVCDGRTWFVALQSLCSEGTSVHPFDAVHLAVEAANGDGSDIILLQPGEYDAAITIGKPLTLRATRKGPASLGTPPRFAEMPTQ